MIPQDRRERKARHEAGHAAMALKLGMFGEEGVIVVNDAAGDVGSTSILWNTQWVNGAQRIRDRATIAMAGVAAEPIRLRPQLACPRRWDQICGQCEDLRDDIQKMRCLHWISLDPARIWSQYLKPYLAENRKASEDENDVLDYVCRLPEYGDGSSYDIAETYFISARSSLAEPQSRCFVERASSRLIGQPDPSGIPSDQCRQMWADCNPHFWVRWWASCEYWWRQKSGKKPSE